MDVPNPVLIEIVRGDLVESRHRGAAAVVGSDGSLIAAWGDIDSPVYARSAVKPFQALPLIETGAAAHYDVSDEELALACASHGGEPKHVSKVAAWLARVGLSEGNLACGPHPPMTQSAADDLILSGRSSDRLHNNCSGKHAGFLTTALYLREPIIGYGGEVHPAQLRVKRLLAQLADVSFDLLPAAQDGCGVPTFALPIRGLALAAARFAAPAGLGRHRAAAAARIVGAMAAHGDLIAGEQRFDSLVAAEAGGAVVTKGGAEAVHVAILPEARLGVAVKIDDGTKRAAESAIASLLLRFASPATNLHNILSHYAQMPIRNTTGARIGVMRPSESFAN